MKNGILLLSLVLIINVASAKPTITVLPPQPSSNLWIGETVTFSFVCSEPSQIVQNIEAKITGPITIPNSSLLINRDGDTYSFSLNLNYPFDQLGAYKAAFYCESDNQTDNATSSSATFNIFDLVASIEKINPSNIYDGDKINVYTKIKKSGVELDGNNDISFMVFIDDSEVVNKMPFYISSTKNWVIGNIDPPTVGKHVLKVRIFYDRKVIELVKNIEVKPVVGFQITNIDSTQVLPGGVMTVTASLTARDIPIAINPSSLQITVDSGNTNWNATVSDESTVIKVNLPVLGPGGHEIAIRLDYNGTRFIEKRNITYQVLVSGRISTGDASVTAQIKFKKNGTDYKTITTDSNGYYNGILPSNTYDIEISFDSAKLSLFDANINQFNDSIKFKQLKEVSIDSINSGGIYQFRTTSIDYSRVVVEMNYDNKKIQDENKLMVFKCEDWNSDENSCDSDLKIIDHNLYSERSAVSIEPSRLATFIIGCKKQLSLNLITDKSEYYLKNPVKINGYVEDENKRPVKDADVQIDVLNANVHFSGTTDSNGVFSFEFLSPSVEGNFKIQAKVTKPPYIDDS